MTLIETRFTGAWIIEPRVFVDQRGWFMESWNRQTFAEHGIDAEFVQDNHSRSCLNTVRGLHFQSPPAAQAKLVRCVLGTVWDVIVDIRMGSATYGTWEGHELSASNFRMLYVPIGFAHGFCVLSETAEIQYKCSTFYAPACGRGVAWDDPGLGIDWPVHEPLLSDQDRRHPRLQDLPAYFEA